LLKEIIWRRTFDDETDGKDQIIETSMTDFVYFFFDHESDVFGNSGFLLLERRS
jgi:hypothetical protein